VIGEKESDKSSANNAEDRIRHFEQQRPMAPGVTEAGLFGFSDDSPPLGCSFWMTA
jgi:hypothetical protein